MARSVLTWHRTQTWCAVGALVVVLLGGDLTRSQSSPCRFFIPSPGDQQSPAEENETGTNEVLPAAPRQRPRCRLPVQPHPVPIAPVRLGALPTDSPPPADVLHFTCRAPTPGRGLPLRC